MAATTRRRLHASLPRDSMHTGPPEHRGRLLAGMAVVVSVLVVALAATRPSGGVDGMRRRALIHSHTSAGDDHLDTQPADSTAREAFLLSRSAVEVQVPWAMTAAEFENLYGLENDPWARCVLRERAGGPEGLLREGDRFQLPLNAAAATCR